MATATYEDGVNLASYRREVERLIAERDRARDTAARLEQQPAEVDRLMNAKITVLDPPIKVGDKIKGDRIPELPEGSIVAGGSSFSYSWTCGEFMFGNDSRDLENYKYATFTVLRLGYDDE